MATIRHRTRRAPPAIWVLCVVFLLPGCGHGIARRGIERLIYQPVCPVCKAIRIEDCHCFHGMESAGYCQTSWSSLDATYGMLPEQGGRMPVPDETLLEELPEPKAAAPSKAEATPGSSTELRDDASGTTSHVTQTAARQAAAARGRAPSGQAVLIHVADQDPPPAVGK